MIRTWALFAVLISGALLQEPVLGAADSERRDCPGVRGVWSEVPEASVSLHASGLCLVGNAEELGWRGIIGWYRIRRGTGPGRPPFRAGLGVLAVPADVGAGLPAIGHHQAGRKRDAAQ